MYHARIGPYDALVHLPDGYSSKRWPAIIFLHGAYEAGHDLELLRRKGLPKRLETQDLPFVVISPQARLWRTDELVRFLDAVKRRYKVDPKRIYLTGLSMGGYAVWRLAVAKPRTFAAIAPVCGGYGGPVEDIEKLKGVAVWAFHGARDRVVPLSETTRVVERLRAAGGEPRLTVYPKQAHDAWTRTYRDPRLYEWLLDQKK